MARRQQPETRPDAKPGPDFTVYFVPERENARWIPIGAAWNHRDQEGLSLALDLMPNTPGRLVLRKPSREGGQQ